MTDRAFSKRAEDFVRELFRRRLAGAGMAAEAVERFVQCEAGQPAAWSGGREVAVRTWRYWSELVVYSDGPTGWVEGWRIPGLADVPTEKPLSDEAAVAAARTAVDLPEGAELAHVTRVPWNGQLLARVEWHRVHEGIRVAGDEVVVTIHPGTRQAVEYFRRWRTLRISRGPLPTVPSPPAP